MKLLYAVLAALLLSVVPAVAHPYHHHAYAHHARSDSQGGHFYARSSQENGWCWNWSPQQPPWCHASPQWKRQHAQWFPSFPREPAPVNRSFGFGGGNNDARARAQGLPDCGAYMADVFGFTGKVGRSLWVAWNWASVGHATYPHPGNVVAVWRHHVVRIAGGQNSRGQWLVEDNHGRGGGHEYYRSLSGAVFREIG